MSDYADKLIDVTESYYLPNGDDVLTSSDRNYLDGALDVLYELDDMLSDEVSMRQIQQAVLILIATATSRK